MNIPATRLSDASERTTDDELLRSGRYATLGTNPSLNPVFFFDYFSNLLPSLARVGGQSEGLCSFFKGVEACESSTLKFKDVYNCEIKNFINVDNNFKDIMYNKLGTICQVRT